MALPRRRSRPPRPAASRGRAWGPSLLYVAVALLSLAGGLALLLLSSPTPAVTASGGASRPQAERIAMASAPALPLRTAGADGAAPVPTAGAAVPAMPAPSRSSLPRPAPRAWEPDSDPTPDLSSYVNPGEAPTMAEVIERLHQAGVFGGLGAFSPPGTRPPLVGLAVPDGFELPPGYVRHYQATDDGQRIEPILMFSPDVRFVDASGAPVELPADRVVPPELAPAGLPLRRIVVPGPADAGGPTR